MSFLCPLDFIEIWHTKKDPLFPWFKWSLVSVVLLVDGCRGCNIQCVTSFIHLPMYAHCIEKKSHKIHEKGSLYKWQWRKKRQGSLLAGDSNQLVNVEKSQSGFVVPERIQVLKDDQGWGAFVTFRLGRWRARWTFLSSITILQKSHLNVSLVNTKKGHMGDSKEVVVFVKGKDIMQHHLSMPCLHYSRVLLYERHDWVGHGELVSLYTALDAGCLVFFFQELKLMKLNSELVKKSMLLLCFWKWSAKY